MTKEPTPTGPTRPAQVEPGARIRWAGHEVTVTDRRIGKHRQGHGMDAYLTLDTPFGEKVCHWHASERVTVLETSR